jgi:NifU-like protein
MACHHVPGGLQDLLDETWGREGTKVLTQISPPPTRQAQEAAPNISPYQFAKKIEKAVDQYVRPLLRRDGGDVDVVDIKGMLVYCRLMGACRNCNHANQTLRMMVERTLKEMVDEHIQVIDV